MVHKIIGTTGVCRGFLEQRQIRLPSCVLFRAVGDSRSDRDRQIRHSGEKLSCVAADLTADGAAIGAGDRLARLLYADAVGGNAGRPFDRTYRHLRSVCDPVCADRAKRF